ncbi:MAG TPA: hypothetical protein ENN60_02660 [archaeon]|nr:hypothetical protein [archaeon]
METLLALRKTRLVENFNGKDISTAVLLDILDASRWAMSFQGMQSWEVIIVKDKDRKQQLSELLKQGELKRASVLLVVASNQERASFAMGAAGERLSLIECAALAQNLVVASRDHGVATSVNGNFDEEELKKFVDCPQGVLPLLVVGLGYSGAYPEIKRAPINTFIHTESFGRPWEGDLAEKFKARTNQSAFMRIFG